MASLKPRGCGSKIALEKLTKEIFFENVLESRLSQGESIKYFDFNESRCRILSKSKKIKEDKKGIVYWMTRDCRVQDNWSMLFAQHLALKHETSLSVCFTCFEAHYLYPTKRQFRFLIDGLKLIQKECKDYNIGFYLLNASPKDLAQIIKNNNVGGVVCDFSPSNKHREWQEKLLEYLPAEVPLIQVDAHNIVPAWEASCKQEIMAKTLRPKITKVLPEYLTGFPTICNHKYSVNLDTHNKEIVKIDDAFNIFKPQWEVEEVKSVLPGSQAGLEILHSFMVNGLKFYGMSSNDPSKNHTSNLSYWIHFGHISAQRVAIEVESLKSLYKDQVEKFLEELIVRKELADNYCLYNNNYDNINGAAGWAIKTLNDHKKDKRTWVYSREQLEKAQTHDEIWNAAQLQLVQEGKIHGYMRMYWCKKILEWTESPEKALEYSLWLNDTYGLDGSDPNGFVGVMWSICGVHDQGWKEREIFGKIRYMVDYSLRRKFDMNGYCARYGFGLASDTTKKTKGVKRKAK